MAKVRNSLWKQWHLYDGGIFNKLVSTCQPSEKSANINSNAWNCEMGLIFVQCHCFDFAWDLLGFAWDLLGLVYKFELRGCWLVLFFLDDRQVHGTSKGRRGSCAHVHIYTISFLSAAAFFHMLQLWLFKCFWQRANRPRALQGNQQVNWKLKF